MRRFRSFALAAAGTLALGGFAPEVAHADTFTFSGVVVDYNGGLPLGGITITATPPAGAGPDIVVVTAADGSWAFTSELDEYGLYLDGGADYQSGYRGCAGFPVPTWGEACTFGPGAWATEMLATWASGRILDSATSAGVVGATVEARAADGVTVLATTVTGSGGLYRLTGLAGDEFAYYVNGAAVGYSSGWFGCVAVVPTWGEACTFPPGTQADRFVAAVLGAPRLATGISLRAGTILLIVLPPPGTVVGYELTCTNNVSGVVTVRNYAGSFQSRSGFPRGRSTCTVRAIGPAGPGTPSRPFTVVVR